MHLTNFQYPRSGSEINSFGAINFFFNYRSDVPSLNRLQLNDDVTNSKQCLISGVKNLKGSEGSTVVAEQDEQMNKQEVRILGEV